MRRISDNRILRTSRMQGLFRTITLALFVATAAPVAHHAAAQGGAALLDPASVIHQGIPGETINATVRISNPAPTDLNLRLYLSDWTFDPIGQFTFVDANTLERSASEWVTLPTATLHLGPHETVQLSYEVAVPEDAAPGTHWTVIFAEGEPSDPVPGQAATSISVRVGHIVYVNLPELESSGAITGMFSTPPASPTDAYTVIAQYANTGNVGQGVEGTFTLRDELGDAVIEAQVPRSVVLPGAERAFQINVLGPLPAGNYTALVVLNYGDDEVDVAGAIDIFVEEPLLDSASSGP